jgi:hypothetical protein
MDGGELLHDDKNQRMGYLGLDATEQVKPDNMFQRMFWPSDHAGESDDLGKQGFWVCIAVAMLSAIVLLSQGHWFLALFVTAVYLFGGIGIREHSQVAAIFVAATYWLDQLASLASGRFPGFLGIAAGVLLIANIRGTWIAAKWARIGGPDAMPERQSGTVRAWVVDQMPAKVWPVMQYPFYVIAGLYSLLVIAGVVLVFSVGPAQKVPPATPAAVEPGATVSPLR